MHYQAGDGIVVFNWQGFAVARRSSATTCVFRSAFRHTPAVVGAELLVVIANFPASRLRSLAWRLLAARAIENQAYVVGVNRWGGGQDAKLSRAQPGG